MGLTSSNLSDIKKYKETRGCKIKRLYHTRQQAKKQAKKMTLLTGNGRIRAYKCDYCPFYHIGHNKYAGKP